VKCCQRTKPQSFLVLLQLPAVQLRDAFGLCPELREPLLNHIQTLTPHQVVTSSFQSKFLCDFFGVVCCLNKGGHNIKILSLCIF